MPRLHSLVAALSCASCALVCAPSAAADPATFLDELGVNDAWLPGKNADEVIAAGFAACADLRGGVPVLDEMGRVESRYLFQQGTLFVSAATTHLCPDFAG
ncbi:DUF732 domain-containing protein [Mycolicibacterium austroafricanum]|uniref:DUF732 domain-containing protein n=1 Tax=Mycolicibacterium austroafricanum TaxID=39687 RepID=UPI0009FFA8C2|nr:DUF732 domain-containing protein [Mycolicibacterium austroafricanum]QZY46781.1 DUF732 domain-containing protein [Mycolicibacterium austroafricanum]